MRKRLVFIIFLLIMCAISSYNQNVTLKSIEDTNILWISNDKLEYYTVMRSCDTCIPIRTLAGLFVEVNITEKQKFLLKRVTYNQWLSLLNDDKTDWAANILLYYMYNKDAISLADDKKTWLLYFKNKDIEYWRRFLQNRIQN